MSPSPPSLIKPTGGRLALAVVVILGLLALPFVAVPILFVVDGWQFVPEAYSPGAPVPPGVRLSVERFFTLGETRAASDRDFETAARSSASGSRKRGGRSSSRAGPAWS